MRHAITIFLLATAVVAVAQKKAPAQGNEATTKALINLENMWVAALSKPDPATLDSVFAATYVDTDEHGHRTDKQGVIAVVKSGELKIESIKLSDLKVSSYGDAAVVTGTALQAGNFNGQPLTARIIFTDTFVRHSGKWIAVASHRSAAP